MSGVRGEGSGEEFNGGGAMAAMPRWRIEMGNATIVEGGVDGKSGATLKPVSCGSHRT